MKRLLTFCLVLAVLAGQTSAQTSPAKSTSVPAATIEKISADTTRQMVRLSGVQNELTINVKSDSGSSSIADKHPLAVYFILIAAGLAALASIVSSIIAARTTRLIKDREYKNDYYKKVLDKRLSAIEYADAFVAVFRPLKRQLTGEKYHSVFLSDSEFEKYEEATKQVLGSAFWLNNETYDSIREFNREVRKVKRSYSAAHADDEKIRLLIDEFNSLEIKKSVITRKIASDLKNLDDIDAFIANRESSI